MRTDATRQWIVAQLGARENYAVARALHHRGALDVLLTDVWADRYSFMGLAPQRFRERSHEELNQARVHAFTKSALGHELIGKLSKTSGWDQIIKRNTWFQSVVSSKLDTHSVDERSVVFAYSYAAEAILAAAKRKGATTVLGQIDPAIAEDRLISQVHEEVGVPFERPPNYYWMAWRRETELADFIVVNSDWSKDSLIQEGVASEKIRVLPLAADFAMSGPKQELPEKFSEARPLKLLFLGQVNLRKGIDLLLKAVSALKGLPIRLDIVGPVQVSVPRETENDERICFHGSVPRGRVKAFYRKADIFVFPTRSDGFGLTQLEALSARTPIIASQFCGNVVKDGQNGLVLRDLTVGALTGAIKSLYNDPNTLARLSEHAELSSEYSLDALGVSLESVVSTE